MSRTFPELIRKAQQEIGIQIVCTHVVRPPAIVGEGSVHVVVEKLIKLLTTKIHAKLEGMGARNLGHVIRHLERIPGLRKLSFRIVAEGESARNRDRGEALATGAKEGVNSREHSARYQTVCLPGSREGRR